MESQHDVTERGASRVGRRPSQKPNGGSVQATVILDRSDVAALDEVARELDRSRSDLIREAVRTTWLQGRAGPAAPEKSPANSEPAMSRMNREERAAWEAGVGGLVDAFRQGFAASGATEEELEADIQAARAEVRAERSLEEAGLARGR